MSYMEIRNLKKVYNPYGIHPKVALNGLDFEVEKGDFICIMGASGSGKTTLVNILSTIDEATHGQIFLNQKDLLLLSEKEKANLRKEEIGFIFQNYNLIESLTIKNNILFSLRLNKVDQKRQLEKLNELTKMLNIEEIIDKYPSQCSGGQQQRAAIARALINEPKIIFADEPTGNLDSLNARELMEYLVKINEEKHTTIIMVTHDSFVASYSKKVYYMKDGHLDLSIDRLTKSQDDYYKDQRYVEMLDRQRVNYDHPNALDNDLLIEHLTKLLAGEAIDGPTYDFKLHTRSDVTRHIEPNKVIILEGILVLQDPRIRELADIKIFVDSDDDIRFIRRLVRDINERGRSMDSVISQYLETVKPMYYEFVKPTKRYADIIIPNDKQHDVAVDVIISKIKDIISQKEEA